MTNKTCSLEMVRTLGVGGMATVFLALLGDEGDVKRNVAVKKPHAFLAADPATLAILEDEAALGACIRHPNVVGVIDFVGGDEPALVMEYVDGVDLAKLVRAQAKTGRRLPLDVVAAIARDVLAGLHAAHECRREDGLALDIVHRDVSPQNILVGYDGVCRVTDFGVAKAAWRQQETDQGSIKGKLRYLAPEQLQGMCDRRADIYGAGVVLWELLTGTVMRAGDGVEMLVEILCGRSRAPSTIAPEAAILDDLVLRALEQRADDRFATAADMIAALESAVTIASATRVAAVVAELLTVTIAPVVMVEEVDQAAVTQREPFAVMAMAMANVVGHVNDVEAEYRRRERSLARRWARQREAQRDVVRRDRGRVVELFPWKSPALESCVSHQRNARSPCKMGVWTSQASARSR